MLLNVQGLRALAAFLVVFVHVQALGSQLGLGPAAFEFGNAGVDIFFVISGMIMVMAMRRKRLSAGAFALNRIARIVPFYWVMTLLVFGLALAAPAAFASTQADAVSLFKSLFFIPFERADGRMFPLVFVGWTLNYEMAFYGLFALGLLFANARHGFLFTVAVIALVVLLGRWLAPPSPVAQFYSAPLVLEFAIGMLIGCFGLAPRSGVVVRLLVLGLGLAAFALLVSAPSLWPGAERLWAAGLPAAVMVVCAVWLEKAGWVLKHRGVHLLGDASFAIYLTHIFVTQAVIMAVNWSGMTHPAMLVTAMVGAFVLVGLTGVATHLLVEKPLSSWARTRLGLGRRSSAETGPGGVA